MLHLKYPNLWFWAQIFLGVTSFVAQLKVSLHDVHGIIVVQFALFVCFMGMNLWLTYDEHRLSPSGATRRTLATYALWLTFSIVTTTAIATNPAYRWSIEDSTTLSVAAIGISCVAVFAWVRRLSVTNPMVKGLLSVSFKALPQCLLIWSIMDQGASGISTVNLIIGHVIVAMRIVQIYSMDEGEPRKWLIVGEGANWGTWILVTIAWFIS